MVRVYVVVVWCVCWWHVVCACSGSVVCVYVVAVWCVRCMCVCVCVCVCVWCVCGVRVWCVCVCACGGTVVCEFTAYFTHSQRLTAT